MDLSRNTFAIPKEKLSITNRMALIIKKLQMGEQLIDHREISKNESFLFSKIDEDEFKIAKRSEIFNNSLSYSKYMNMTYKYEQHFPTYCELRIFDVPCEITTDLINKYPQFLQHCEQKTSEIRRANIRINIAEEFQIAGAQNIIKNIKFFEDSIDEFLPLIIGISDFSDCINENNTISINRFAKFMPIKAELNKDKKISPKRESILKIIDILNYFVNIDLGDSFSCGPINVKKSNRLFVRFGSMLLFDEYDIQKFKYINHPGLNIVALYLEIMNSFSRFDAASQKKMFENI